MSETPMSRPGEVAGWPKLVVKYATDITIRKRAVEALKASILALADGNLLAVIDGDFDDEFNELRDALNETLGRLRDMVGRIKIGRAHV